MRAVARTRHAVPLVLGRAAAGFPSPADDYLDRPLHFNELLIENPDATFAVRVVGDSMVGAGIFPGDIAVVDRSKTAVDRSIVLAILDGEFTLKRYRQRGNRCWLEAENTDYAPTELTEDSAFEIWGVMLMRLWEDDAGDYGRLRTLAIIEVMDQVDPALRERLVRDLVVVVARLADQSQKNRCVLHGILLDAQALIVDPRCSSTVPYTRSAALDA